MVSVISGCSYHGDVCYRVHFSELFGFNYLFEAIKRGWNIMIDSCQSQWSSRGGTCRIVHRVGTPRGDVTLTFVSWQLLIIDYRLGQAGPRYHGSFPDHYSADSGLKWRHLRQCPGQFGFIFIQRRRKRRRIVHLHIQSILGTKSQEISASFLTIIFQICLSQVLQCYGGAVLNQWRPPLNSLYGALIQSSPELLL